MVRNNYIFHVLILPEGKDVAKYKSAVTQEVLSVIIFSIDPVLIQREILSQMVHNE